jgi:hypothetical protein
MPNSVWTETASSTSLLLVTSPVDGSSPENVNYLTNADKITLMAQYAAALATKTSLDTLAAGLGISSSFYDAAVANISSALITAGAPTNWATIWPDGTTSGPWSNIQGDLANLWAQIASQQTALQAAISAQQAAAAQAVAIATAASAAVTQISAAVTVLTSAPLVVSSLPSLPNVTYPAGRQVLDSANSQIYTNVAGAWVPLAVPAASITGQMVGTQISNGAISTPQLAAGAVTAGTIAANAITAGQIAAGAIGATQIAAGSITAAALTLTAASLIPDPDFASGISGWANFVQRLGSTNAAVPASCPAIYAAQFSGGNCSNKSTIPVNAGETYFISCTANNNGGSGAPIGCLLFGFNAAGAAVAGVQVSLSTATGWVVGSGSYTIPTGIVAISVGPLINSGFVNGSAGAPWFTNMVLRRMTDASLIVDGTITASKISAGAITADMITTGTLNAALVTVANLNASNITTGTLAATKVLFNDGSALTTASRVLTSYVYLQDTLFLTTTPQVLVGLGWSVVAASASDVFIITSSVQMGSNVAGSQDITFAIAVDGNISTPVYSNTAYAQYGTITAPYFAAFTGLSAGAHTIQLYANAAMDNSPNVISVTGDTYAILQRIF